MDSTRLIYGADFGVPASSNERLLVTNGLVVSPVRAPEEAAAATQLSMREMIGRINNEKDFHTYVTSHASSVPARPVEIRYEKHPVSDSLLLDV